MSIFGGISSLLLLSTGMYVVDAANPEQMFSPVMVISGMSIAIVSMAGFMVYLIKRNMDERKEHTAKITAIQAESSDRMDKKNSEHSSKIEELMKINSSEQLRVIEKTSEIIKDHTVATNGHAKILENVLQKLT